MKKFILVIFFAIFLFQLNIWFGCSSFPDSYHFSTSAISLSYDDLVHNDTGTPLFLIRFYHNKVILFITSLYTKYLLFTDIKFWVNILLPAGIFGFACGIWYGGKRLLRSRILKILVAAMFIFPAMEILTEPHIFFPVKIILFPLPYEIFSLLGISKFIDTGKDKKAYVFLLILLCLSVWWQIVLSRDIRNYCV